MAKTNSVITIGRQYGSGGRVIGRMLAERLEVPYYDKELLTEAARQSGICEELFQNMDEKPTRSLLFSLVTSVQSGRADGGMYMDMPLNHRIFLAQFDAIRRIASEGPCVLVGRCADYVLRDQPNLISVFIKADMSARVARAIERGADPSRAEDVVRKADKQRASYYNYFSTSTWADITNYDICVDSSRLGYEGACDLLIDYIGIVEKRLREARQ